MLVTGATGLVGNNVVRLLLAEGVPVRVLLRQPQANRPLADLPVEIHAGDVIDPESVRAAMERRGRGGACGRLRAAGLAEYRHRTKR